MILLKINDNGELEWNLEEIKTLSDLYDRGCKSEEAYKAKVIRLIWEQGYTHAMDDMQDMQEKTMLLFGCVGGHA
jgi:hypothetical protein